MGLTLNYSLACSGSIAIMDNDEIFYSEGFGMADKEKSLIFWFHEYTIILISPASP